MIMKILTYSASEIFRNERLCNELCRLYLKIFESVLQANCENCIADGLFQIKYHFNNKKDKKMEEQKECKFRFKEGTVLTVSKWHMHISNENLTDALAIKILRINKKNLSNFAKYPENIAELAGWEDTEIEGGKAVTTPVSKDEQEKKEKLKMDNIPTVEELCLLLKKDLIAKVEEYPNAVKFDHNDTKTVIARAYIDRLILDSE